MLSIFELISKQVLSLENGKNFGYVLNIEFLNLKASKLIVLDEFSTQENMFSVPFKNIYNAKNQIITLKNTSQIEPCQNQTPKLLGCKIISQEGEILDYVKDVLINEKTFTIQQIVGQNLVFKPEKIYSIANGVVILRGNAKVIKHSSQPTKSNTSNDIKLNKNDLISSSKKEENSFIESPKKIIGNYNFLVGRKLTKNLYLPSGKPLIMAGTTLTEQIISKAILTGNINFLLNNSIILQQKN